MQNYLSILLLTALSLSAWQLSANADCDTELELCQANCNLQYSSGDDNAERTGCNLRCRADWGVCVGKPATDKVVEGAKAGLEASKGFFKRLFAEDDDEAGE